MNELALVGKSLPTLPSFQGLTAHEIELAKSSLVFNLVAAMKDNQCAIETTWLKQGAIWHFLTKNKLWSAYGEHIKNASDFLREIDLGVTRRSLEYYASIVDSKIGEYLTANNLIIPVTKLRTIAHVVKESGDVEGWISKCDLPIKALEDEVKSYKGLITTDSCLHPADKQVPYTRCSICQKWLQK